MKQVIGLINRALHDLRTSPKGQSGGLDVLRTCAVLLVVLGHSGASYLRMGGLQNHFSTLPIIRDGWFGVDIFFVLSGYLIGKQLWKEVRDTGTVDFKQFVVRRGLRIWPLYAVTFLFVFFVLHRAATPIAIWWTDPTFLTNYLQQGHGIVKGGWSLCTEEQFYITAPLLLLICAPRIKSLESCRKYLWGLLAILPIVRALTWWHLTGSLESHDPQKFPALYYPAHTHCDGLVMGMILANLSVSSQTKFRGFAASIWPTVIAAGAFLVMHSIQQEVLSFSAISILVGCVMWYFLTRLPGQLNFLNSRVFYVISRLSYGMYLNHEYLCPRIARFALHYVPMRQMATLHATFTAGLIVLVSMAIATATFCLIEYPFLELRTKVLRNMKARREAAKAAATASAIHWSPGDIPADPALSSVKEN